MVNIYFATMFAIMAFSSFFTYQSVHSIDRAVMYIPIEIFQNNTMTLNYNGNVEDFYFDKNGLKNDLDSYFEASLKNHVRNYHIEYFFFNSYLGQVCVSSKCAGIKICVESEVFYGYRYQKSTYYAIRRTWVWIQKRL